VEALEEAQQPTVKESLTVPLAPAPAGSLVERVASVGVSPFYAKAAIREAAAWLRKQGWGNAACELEQEVGQ
jgi:hypothetical protein